MIYNNLQSVQSMRYVQPIRLKILMGMFFVTGSLGIMIGLQSSPTVTVFITFLGVINIGLGAFFTFIFLTQRDREPDKRKKKRR